MHQGWFYILTNTYFKHLDNILSLSNLYIQEYSTLVQCRSELNSSFPHAILLLFFFLDTKLCQLKGFF